MTITTFPPATPEAKPDPRVFRPEGQTFLVGHTLFLRGLEPEDAHRASAWRNSPYPITSERAGEIIKEMSEKQRPGHHTWVACRRSDGAPVGSIRMRQGSDKFVWTDLSPYVDPALPDGEAIMAETVRLVVEWGFGEAEVPRYRLHLGDDQPGLRAAAARLGMHHDVSWRERRWRGGRWHTAHTCSIGHPAWVRRLGDPSPGIVYAMLPDDPARWRPRPHPTLGTVDGDPPANAVMVGPRVFLRPLELADAVDFVLGDRRDEETYMDSGRYPGSVEDVRRWFRSMSKDDPPGDVSFAVCRRSDGTLIGMNGVSSIDRIDRTGETESWFFYGLGRDQGFGTEAKHLLLAYAFDRLGLHSVRSMVWGPNGRSAAALIKQGYRECGRTPWAGTRDGEYTYYRHFDLLADEWREMTARAAVSANDQGEDGASKPVPERTR